MPPNVNVTKDGHIILGAFIGTPGFIHEQARLAVDRSSVLLDKLKPLSSKGSAQVALTMSVKCINVRLHYMVRVNPCCFFGDQLVRHDTLIRDFVDSCLILPGYSTPLCCMDRGHS